MTLRTASGDLNPTQIETIQTQLAVPSAISVADEIVLEGHLNSGNQDTNDATRIYAWQATRSTSAIDLTEPSKIVFAEASNYLVDAFIRIADATANDRAIFYMEIQHYATDDTLRATYKAPSTYVRDDTFSDKAASGLSSNIVVSDGDYVRIRTIRLESQDPNDANPAHQTLSTILVRQRSYVLV